MKKIEYKKNSHSKYLLRYHFVMTTKYRHNILNGDIVNDIKQILNDISKVEGYEIEIMETDENHIHLLIEAKSTFSLFSIVHKIKIITTNRIWKKHEKLLKKHYWKENTFWSDGYFVCSIGEANSETIRKYIEEQG
jgi:putative transposase